MYRVFLSSTYTDLIPYRNTVQSALRQFGAIDVSMEHFGARDERPVDECIRLVQKESDLFVGIYAYKYGFIPDGSDISISEIEYKAASDSSIPRFIYIIDENALWKPALIDSGEPAEKLKKFKEALRKRHVFQPFANEDQLATRVVADVGRHIAMINSKQVGPANPIPVKNIELESSYDPVKETENEWSNRRNSIYSEHHDIFLTHVIRPSNKKGQKFDVFIYLIRHNSEDLSDVQSAEFFLGRFWGNKIFTSENQNGFIGISTSAYGTFLCVCKVIFKDGSFIYIDRYVDFEAQRTGGANT